MPPLASAAPVWNLDQLRERGAVIGVMAKGGKAPFPEADRFRALSGLGIATNTFTCPRRLGGVTFFRMPGGLGMSVMARGPRHMARVDIDERGQIVGALKIPCRVAARAR